MRKTKSTFLWLFFSFVTDVLKVSLANWNLLFVLGDLFTFTETRSSSEAASEARKDRRSRKRTQRHF